MGLRKNTSQHLISYMGGPGPGQAAEVTLANDWPSTLSGPVLGLAGPGPGSGWPRAWARASWPEPATVANSRSRPRPASQPQHSPGQRPKTQPAEFFAVLLRNLSEGIPNLQNTQTTSENYEFLNQKERRKVQRKFINSKSKDTRKQYFDPGSSQKQKLTFRKL